MRGNSLFFGKLRCRDYQTLASLLNFTYGLGRFASIGLFEIANLRYLQAVSTCPIEPLAMLRISH